MQAANVTKNQVTLQRHGSSLPATRGLALALLPVLAVLALSVPMHCFGADQAPDFVDPQAQPTDANAANAATEAPAVAPAPVPAPSQTPSAVPNTEVASPAQTLEPSPDATKKVEAVTASPGTPSPTADSAAEAKADEPGEKGPLVKVSDMLHPPMPDEEKPLYTLIIDTSKAKIDAGVRSLLGSKKLYDLSLREAADKALARAIPIQLQSHEAEIARQALRESKAVFLPVFDVGTSYTNINVFERERQLSVAEKLAVISAFKDHQNITTFGGLSPKGDPVTEILFLQKSNIVFFDPKNPQGNFFSLQSPLGTVTDKNGNVANDQFGPLTFTGVDAADQAAYITRIKNFLSGKQLGGFDPTINTVPELLPAAFNFKEASHKQPQDISANLTGQITQQLPWGPQLALIYAPTYHNAPYDQFGNTFNRPYFTSVTGELFIPLPFTKNFGPYSSHDVGVKISKLDEKRAIWDLKSVINSTLLNVHLAWLDLVDAVKNIESATQNRKSMEFLVGQTQQLLNNNRTTAFGMDQIEAELLRVRVSEEQAWNIYLNASNTLVNLLNLELDTVLVPVGYSRTINEHVAYNLDDALAVGLKHRAELHSQSYLTREQELRVKFRDQQTRPDVSVTGNVTLSQATSVNGPDFRGTPVGFRDPIDSLRNLTDPDARAESYTALYQRQLFLRAEKAALVQTKAILDENRLTQRITENTVAQQVNDALAVLDSAKGRIAAAQASVDAFKRAYDLALEQQNAGRLTEFEMVSRSQDWLNSQVSLIDAQIAYKKADSQLLFAQGILPNEFPEMTSPNEFDRYRLGLLNASNALHFFDDGDVRKELKRKEHTNP